jgi:hypothetical protein
MILLLHKKMTSSPHGLAHANAPAFRREAGNIGLPTVEDV